MTSLVQNPNFIPRRLLLKAMLVAALIVGSLSAIGFFYPIESMFYALRSQVAQRPLNTDVVMVGIDDRSLAKHGGWPWDRQVLADAIRKIDAAGAKRIVFDFQFADRGLGRNDPLLKAANEAKADVFFGVLPSKEIAGDDFFEISREQIGKILVPDDNKIAFLGADIDFMGHVRGAPTTVTAEIDGKATVVPSVSHILSSYRNKSSYIYADYNIENAIDRKSIGDINSFVDEIKGKNVLIFPQSHSFNDLVKIPFYGYDDSAIYHVLLSQVDYNEYSLQLTILLYVSFIFASIFSMYLNALVQKKLLNYFFGAISIFSVCAFMLERVGVRTQIIPFWAFGIIYLSMVKYWWDRQVASDSNATDSLTGLPNGIAHVRAIEAYDKDKLQSSRIVVAATIANSSDISSILNEIEILDFYREVERRILSSNGADMIYHAGYDSVTWDVPASIFPDAEDYAKAMRALMLQPFVIGEHTIRADLSYGFDLDLMVGAYRRLANALNGSQRAATEHKLFFGNANFDHKNANWRVALSSSIETLLAQDQFSLAFQPKLNLSTGEVDSAECLLRWTHPHFGSIPPSEFIEAAEQGSAINDLTNFVLRKAMAALTIIREQKPNFTLAVNLSPRLLDEPDLADRILAMFDEFGLEKSAIILEITEAASLADRSVAMDMLDNLAQSGVHLSIDDYGTGRSTLDYLRLIPAKEVKLDRSFVGDMIINGQNRNLVESTINLARTLNLSTVAEGVEDKETLRLLIAMGCTHVQGYYISWPLNFSEFTKKFVGQTTIYQMKHG